LNTWSAALAVLAVSLILLVHEFGHFIGAKIVGMRVEVFSLGFWKRLVGFKIGDTDYRLSLIPLGGYVKVSGELPAHGGGKDYEFWSKTPGQRALFVVGGVVMNFVLAMVLFVIAFAVGVPLVAAEVGEVESDSPAWLAGMQPGDQIVAVGSVKEPTFRDVTRAVALGGGKEVMLEVKRGNELKAFRLAPEYDPHNGYRVVGIVPPIEPVVTGLAGLVSSGGRCPAQEAGVKIGDRILAINGTPVQSAGDVAEQMLLYPHDEVELLLERKGQQLTVSVLTEPLPRQLIGISGIGTTVHSLAAGGMAEKMGLKRGDCIVAANGHPVGSWVEVEHALTGTPGGASLQVVRDGAELTLIVAVPDAVALNRLARSVELDTGTRLAWVREGGPAWQAGMRPGDVLLSVAGNEVHTWEDVLEEGRKVAHREHEATWCRGKEILTGLVKGAPDTTASEGYMGITMDMLKAVRRHYGVVGAVRQGFANTFDTLSEILLMLRGFATRQVSPRTLGGIVTIAYASYQAARLGIIRLIHLTAMFSAAIGLLNILPIPVLDGGYLLILAVEKARGRRLGERAISVVQSIGLALIILLAVYVTWNDIRRFL
jgi:regulator of sigma E protease